MWLLNWGLSPVDFQHLFIYSFKKWCYFEIIGNKWLFKSKKKLGERATWVLWALRNWKLKCAESILSFVFGFLT